VVFPEEGQVEALDELFATRPGCLPVQPPQSRDRDEKLLDSYATKVELSLRKEADCLPGEAGMRHQVDVLEPDAARCRFEQSKHLPHESRLARSIGSGSPDFARLDGERDPGVRQCPVPIPFDQVLHLEQWHMGRLPFL
jgi:hypothetical protein